MVSTTSTYISDVESSLQRLGVTYQKLPVAYPFHFRWIDVIEAPFLAELRAIRYGRLRLPVVCCAGAETIGELAAHHLWRATREPIRFQQAIEHLERRGAHLYVDVSPGGTLATFIKYLLTKEARSEARSILSPFGQDARNLATLLETQVQTSAVHERLAQG